MRKNRHIQFCNSLQNINFMTSFRKLVIILKHTCTHLPIEFKHKPQHTMSCRMLRTKVKSHIANFLLNRSKLVVPWWHLPLGWPLIWIHYWTFKLLCKLMIWKPFLGSPLLWTVTLDSTNNTVMSGKVLFWHLTGTLRGMTKDLSLGTQYPAEIWTCYFRN
jgi:hypothetical protein